MRNVMTIALRYLISPFFANAQTVDESYLELLQWRSIGPSRGGRVVTVAGDPVSRMVFYHGATGCGVSGISGIV